MLASMLNKDMRVVMNQKERIEKYQDNRIID